MAAPATVIVFDEVYDESGIALANAQVTCVLESTVETFAGGLISAKTLSTTTDLAGHFAFVLVPNDLLVPLGSVYTIQIPSIGRTYQIAPQSTNGASQRSTASNVIVSAPQAVSGVINGPVDVAVRSLTALSGPPYTPSGVGGALAGNLFPSDEAGAVQVAAGIIHSTGVPNNANGSNGWWAISDNGNLYKKTAGVWAAVGGMTNPLTTKGDLIAAAVGGTATRFGVGADAQILTADSTQPLGIRWAASAAGFSDPTTTRGDLIVKNAALVAARLGLGSDGKYLRSDGSDPSWQLIAEGDIANLATDLAAKATGASLTFKNAVRAASVAAAGTPTGLLVIDGYTTVAGDRILLKNQATGSQNGIWVVAAGAWSRPADFPVGANGAGSAVFVQAGATNGGQIWALATNSVITIDTTAETWSQVSGGGGGGLVIDGTAGDYNAVGASLVLGATGKAIDAGTQLAHGSGYLPDAHHPKAHGDTDHTGANKVQGWLAGTTKFTRPIINVIPTGLAVVTMADDGANNKQDWTLDVSPVKAVLTSDVVVSNTAVETQLLGYTIPANTIVAGTTYMLVLDGNVDLVATVAVTLKLKVGGNTIASYGPNGTSSTTVKPYYVIGTVTFRTSGAAGTVVGGYTIRQEWSGAAAGGAQALTSTATTTVDTTNVGGLVFEMTATWGTGAVGNVIRAFQGYIKLEKA